MKNLIIPITVLILLLMPVSCGTPFAPSDAKMEIIANVPEELKPNVEFWIKIYLYTEGTTTGEGDESVSGKKPLDGVWVEIDWDYTLILKCQNPTQQSNDIIKMWRMCYTDPDDIGGRGLSPCDDFSKEFHFNSKTSYGGYIRLKLEGPSSPVEGLSIRLQATSGNASASFLYPSDGKACP